MNVCNNKMKILLLLVLVLPLLLEVSAYDDCYYFNFDICSGIKPSDKVLFRVAYLVNNNVKYLSSYAMRSDNCERSEEFTQRILEPCLCRKSYRHTHSYFVPADDSFHDDYVAFCIAGSQANNEGNMILYSWLDGKGKIPLHSEELYDQLMSKVIKNAEEKCPILKHSEKCRDMKLLQNDRFTFAALKNGDVSYFYGTIINETDRCDMSILELCLCRPSHDEPVFLVIHYNETSDDYPAICIVGNATNERYREPEIRDILMNGAMSKYHILKHAEECRDTKLLQNETFTFAALKNNTVSISSTSIINETDRYDISILYPCLCRPNYDEPLFFFLPDNDTFGNYPAMCIVGNAANKKYPISSELEIYDLLMSKMIEYMPSSLINPFIIDNNNDTKSCTDIYGNPTKDVGNQGTCMISFDFSRVSNMDFMYAGPLLGSSMLNFGGSDEFTKSDVISSCPSTTKLPKFELTDRNWNDRCFWENTMNEAKVQCCCANNPSLCSPPMLTANESKKMLCLSTNYVKMNFQVTQTAIDFLKRFPACAISLTFGSRDVITNFQFQYGHSEACDSNVKSKVTVEDPSMFCSSNLEMFKKITVIKCCTDGHFCNRKLVPEYDETTWCSRQNRMEQIALGTSSSTCTHFYDLGIKNFTKILIGFNAEIPDGQPQIVNSSKDNTFKYDYVYAKIVHVDHPGCPKLYDKNDEYRPIIQVVCEGNKCDEDIFEKIPIPVPSFQCQNLSEPFVEDRKYEAVMENSVGWICYVEIKNDHTIQAGELIDFTNHTNCLQTDVFHVDDDHHFCCKNVFNDAQENSSCTIENLIKKSPDMATKDNPLEEPHPGYYCKIQSISNIPCAKPGCFVSRLPAQSDGDNQIEPAGCKEHAENYIINDKDNTQMASISLACLSSKRNGCSVLKDVEGNERIVCCCDGKECDKLQRNLPKKVGKLISSFKTKVN